MEIRKTGDGSGDHGWGDPEYKIPDLSDAFTHKNDLDAADAETREEINSLTPSGFSVLADIAEDQDSLAEKESDANPFAEEQEEESEDEQLEDIRKAISRLREPLTSESDSDSDESESERLAAVREALDQLAECDEALKSEGAEQADRSRIDQEAAKLRDWQIAQAERTAQDLRRAADAETAPRGERGGQPPADQLSLYRAFERPEGRETPSTEPGQPSRERCRRCGEMVDNLASHKCRSDQ